MFDLLGLPMCNTGLSLFRMACRTASGPRFGGAGVSGGRPSALASAATGKWKLKRKTNNNNNNINCSKKDSDTAIVIHTMGSTQQQPPSASRQSSLYGPGKQLRGSGGGGGDGGETVHSRTVSPVWGNGWDWTRPVDSEGDWVRVFPFVPATMTAQPSQLRWGGDRIHTSLPSQQLAARPVSSTDNTAHTMIKNIQEYLRCCKKAARLCDDSLTAVSDDKVNGKLKDLFPAVTITWLPPN